MGGPGARLRAAFDAPEMPIVVAIYDALSARLVEAVGFPIACLGSSTVSNTLLGGPDAGIVTLTDMEYMVRRTTLATDLPILVDVDNGYGNVVNVHHTVRTLESAGAAGIMIEDQVAPPRTPGLGRLGVVSVDEGVAKIKAAVDARRADDFFLIARTDSVSVEGLDAAIDRVNRYIEAGADCAFLYGSTNEEIARIGKEVVAPHRMVPVGGFPGRKPSVNLTVEEYRALGIDILSTGIQMVWASAVAMYEFLVGLAKGDFATDGALAERIATSPIADWGVFSGMARINEIESRFPW